MTPAKEESALEKFALALFTGGLASAIGKTAVAPFERIRLLLQTQSLIAGHAKPYNGLFDALQRIPKEQGITSLWRGNVPNLLRIVPTYGVRFTLFDYFQSVASIGLPKGEPLSLPRQMASGALSGLVTCVVTYPLDLARTRMSATAASLDAAAAASLAANSEAAGVAGSKSAPSASTAAPSAHQKITTAGALRTVVQNEGYLGLYRGLFVSVLEITPYLAISLGGYEYLKARLPPERSNDPFVKLTCAWGVGLLGSLTCFPIDTVKRRLMLDGAPGFQTSNAVTVARAAVSSSSSSSGAHATTTPSSAATPLPSSTRASAGTVGSVRGAVAFVQAMYRTGGIGIFYKGCLINAFKSAPAVAITFVANDALKDVFRAKR